MLKDDLVDEETKRMLDDHEKRISVLEGKRDISPGIKKQESVKEFLLTKKPEGDVQKTLAIGYYIEKQKEFDKFNVKDLENTFREARESIPDNINDKVNKNIASGYMMIAKEKKDNCKAWNLTSTGERVVENGFK
jgi:hypothetical protein